MTEQSKKLAAILRSEYGIMSMKELETAIREQGKLDISVLCENPSMARNTRKGDDDVR